MRHHTQYNRNYRLRLSFTLRWTWRGKTHYLDVGP